MTQDIALLKFEEKVFYAKSPCSEKLPPFFTAPALLIQNVYEREPLMARKILRSRIFTNAKPSASLLGMVKVAAKRITTELAPHSAELKVPSDAIDLSHLPSFNRFLIPKPIEARATEQQWMEFALSLIVPKDKAPSLLYQRDRPVAALLLSPDMQLLAAAINTNSRIRTQHAEMNLLLEYYERTGLAPPAGATILVTLKPCKMCAAMICDFSSHAPDRGLPRVFYHQDDPGPNATRTALDLQNPPIQFKL